MGAGVAATAALVGSRRAAEGTAVAEGDSIRRLADRLDARVGGRLVVAATVRHNRYATVELGGRRLTRIDAAGKHLLMRLVGHDDSEGVTIHSHLRMSGRWTVGIPPRTPVHRRRIELHLDDGRILAGIDLPVLHIGPTRREHDWIGHLGPDLCGPTFDGDTAARHLTAAGATALAAALLDQRRVAGIGNLYAVELPFLVAVSPWRPAKEVDGMARLVRLARALLTANAVAGRQSTTGRTARRHQHWIYGRRGQPCPVCGTALDGADRTPWHRSTWWCPACQTSTSVDLRRARQLLRAHGNALRRLDQW